MINRKSVFALFLSLSGLAILLSALFLTLVGVVDLSIIPTWSVNKWIEYLSNVVLFLSNCYFMFYFCIDDLKERNKLFLIFIPLFLLGTIYVIHPIILSFLFPITYLLVVTKTKCLKRMLQFILLTILYQYISMIIKVNVFDISQNGKDLETSLVYSIDLFIFYIFLIKGVKHNVVLVTVKSLLFPKSKCFRQDEKTCHETIDYSDLTIKQRRLFAVMIIAYQVIQLIVVLLIGTLNDMFFELLCMLPMFWIGRWILRKSWHSDKLWLCSLVTFIAFYILTKITPSFEISLFLVVVFSGLFVYLLYHIGVKSNRLEDLEERYSTDFTKYGLTAEMAKFAYDWKVAGMHDKDLMVKYDIRSFNTLNSRKRRIKLAMNTK